MQPAPEEMPLDRLRVSASHNVLCAYTKLYLGLDRMGKKMLSPAPASAENSWLGSLSL